MLDIAFNVQINGKPLKTHYLVLTSMHGVKYTIYLFFNDFSKIPTVNKVIQNNYLQDIHCYLFLFPLFNHHHHEQLSLFSLFIVYLIIYSHNTILSLFFNINMMLGIL